MNAQTLNICSATEIVPRFSYLSAMTAAAAREYILIASALLLSLASSWRAGADSGVVCVFFCFVVDAGFVQLPSVRLRSAHRMASTSLRLAPVSNNIRMIFGCLRIFVRGKRFRERAEVRH